jgi:hypothetical protein
MAGGSRPRETSDAKPRLVDKQDTKLWRTVH